MSKPRRMEVRLTIEFPVTEKDDEKAVDAAIDKTIQRIKKGPDDLYWVVREYSGFTTREFRKDRELGILYKTPRNV